VEFSKEDVFEQSRGCPERHRCAAAVCSRPCRLDPTATEGADQVLNLLGVVADHARVVVPNATIIMTTEAPGVTSTIDSNGDSLYTINTLEP
jgi:hypothetical protein